MSRTSSALLRFAAVLAVVAFVFAILITAWQPWSSRWGATAEEVERALPGDEIVPVVRSGETRAITIQAPVDRVWPWIAQLGQDRGGFYSYTLLENLVGCRMPDADRIHPEHQTWKAGDKLWMYPPERLDGMGSADLRLYEPEHVLAFGTRQIGTPAKHTPDGSWSFVVEPVSDHETRLLVRGRALRPTSPIASALESLVFQPAHHVMERKTMTSIKSRAEGRGGPTPLADDIEIACWTLLALMFVASGVLAMRGRSLARALVAMLAAGIAFQALTFVGPGAAVSLVVTVVVAALVPWRKKAWESSPTLMEAWLPRYEFRDVVSVRTHASPAEIMRAVREVTTTEMPIATLLGVLRYLPSWIARHPVPKPSERPFFDDLRAMNNIVLAEDEREIVLGVIARLHDIVDQHPVPLESPAAFASFAEPNHQKLAMSIRLVPERGALRMVFDHRTHAIDRAAYVKFSLYWWLLIKWGSAVVVWMLLRAIRRRAEHRGHAPRNWVLAWCAVPVFAIVNGAIRDATYGIVMSRTLSHSFSAIPLVIVILAWASFLEVRWPLASLRTAARVGAVWLSLTLAFELGLGAALHVPLREMLAEYDVSRGHVWPLVPLTMAIAPALTFWWRSLRTPPSQSHAAS